MPLTPVRLLRTFRYALYFDGVDDRVVVPHSDYLDIQSGNRITIIMRMTPLGWQSGYPVGVVLDKRTEKTANYNWEFNDTVMVVRIHANNQLYGLSIPHALRELNEYAMVLDGAVLKAYKNGVLVASRSDVPPSGTNSADLVIGSTLGAEFHAEMILYRVLIYNRPLSDWEIEWNYRNPESPITEGLVLWLRLDEGTGTTAHDSSGYNNHGTIIGARWVSSEGTAPSLMNVNITGSAVTLNVNIVSQTAALDIRIVESLATLNVNIASQTVTINTNIEAQTVDLRIFTPSGRWVSASDLVSTYVEAKDLYLPPNSIRTILHVSGKRGRLKYLGIWLTDNNAGATPLAITFQIFVDGGLVAEFDMLSFDRLVGFPVLRLRGALAHHLLAGLPLPFNTARLSTSPEKYLIMPFHNGPRGGLTYIVWDRTNGIITSYGAYLEIEFEFTSSLTIRAYNADSSVTFVGDLIAVVGEYL